MQKEPDQAPETAKSPWRPSEAAWLTAILLIAAALRFGGLFNDYPYFFNPDETRLIRWGMAFHYLDPGISEWGALPLLLVRLLDSTLGLFHQHTAAGTTIAARTLSAAMGCAGVGMTYALARKIFTAQTGKIAAILTAFSVLHIQYSHFYSLDGVFALLVLAAFFPIIDIARAGKAQNYALAGLLVGLTVSTRLNGVLLFAPLGAAHLIDAARHAQTDPEQDAPPGNSVWRRIWSGCLRPALLTRGKFLLVAILWSPLSFFALNPAAALDTKKYLFEDGLLWVLLQTSGAIKSQYTVQFEYTTPWFYFSNVLFWGAGPFLLAAYVAGLGQAARRWRTPENIVLLSFLIVYLWIGATARIKFIRYSLPLLPLLNILAAQLLYSLCQRCKSHPIQKHLATACLWLVIAGTGLYSCAFVSIYSRPDPRIEASQWIRENIPAGAVVARESDDAYFPPALATQPDPSIYQIKTIDLEYLYQSSSLALESRVPEFWLRLDTPITRRGKAPAEFSDPGQALGQDQKWRYILDTISGAEYLVVSDRHRSAYQGKEDLFPAETKFYSSLFDGQLNFSLIQIFESRPTLFGWPIDDRVSELTFRVFDHPTVWIFKANGGDGDGDADSDGDSDGDGDGDSDSDSD